MKKLKLLLALMVATGTFKAYAQAVVYNFDAPCSNALCADNCHGVGTSLPFLVNNTIFASAGSFNLGPGLGPSSATCGGSPMNGFSAGDPNNPSRARWARLWTVTATPNTNDYFSFTLTTNPFDLVSMTQVIWREKKSPSDGPTQREVRTSTDGFITWTTHAVIPNNSTTDIWATRSVMTGLPTFNGSIEVRIYGYSAVSSSGTLRLDNVRVFATVLLTNLPIELISFTGEKIDERKVRLLWSTASEQNNDYFTVYRSLDTQLWQEVGTLPGAGTSQSRIDYELVDVSPFTGTNYYKLRQTDFDGTSVDSDVIAVDVDVGDKLAVFPNPVASGQTIRATKRVDFIIDKLGRLVQFDPKSIAIETPGVYTLVHVDENGFSNTCRVIVTN